MNNNVLWIVVILFSLIVIGFLICINECEKLDDRVKKLEEKHR